jgi:hypothetical protein
VIWEAVTEAHERGGHSDDELAAFVAAPSPLGDLDVAAMRAGIAARAALRSPGPELTEVRDLMVASRPARLYRLAPEHPWPASSTTPSPRCGGSPAVPRSWAR